MSEQDKLTGTVPRPKRRAGVMPTKKERDRSKPARKPKHPNKEE